MKSITLGVRHSLTDQQTLSRWLPAAASVIVALGPSPSQSQLENAVNWDRHTYDVLLTAQALFNQIQDDERTFIRKDGSRFRGSLVVTALTGADGHMLIDEAAATVSLEDP